MTINNSNEFGTILSQNSIELYWNSYKNLEKELITYAELIYIDDDQKTVYSMRIAELILRTAAGIESLCKDLYATLGCTSAQGTRFNYDKPCIQEFNRRWDIDKKIVEINHPFIRFRNREIAPFTNAVARTINNPDANIWKSAYNDIKHNFMNKLKSANIQAFIEALAALYLLNIIAKGCLHDIAIPNRSAAEKFDATFGSMIYSVKINKVLDAKSIGADGIVLRELTYKPDATYCIRPIPEALEKIYDVMKKVSNDAKTENTLKAALNNLLLSKEIQIPLDGQLNPKDVEKLNFKAQSIAFSKYAQEFGNMVSNINYRASLNIKQDSSAPSCN